MSAGAPLAGGWRGRLKPEQEASMVNVTAVRRRVEEAEGLAGVLDAAYAGFEAIMSGIWEHEERTGDSFAAFDFAAAAAAEGRDAVAAAPSLPRVPAAGHDADLSASGPDHGTGELAAELAELAGLLAARLRQAAEALAAREDRAACWLAAQHAVGIRALLAGDGP